MDRLTDTGYAEVYLATALEEYRKDGDIDAFLLALKHVAMAKGGISRLAKQAKLNRSNLYRVLSKEGNPRLDTVGAILHNLGFKLSVEAV